MRDNSVVRWLIVAVAALAIVAMFAWARNDPGIDDRDGDPEDVIAVSVDTTDLAPDAHQQPALTPEGDGHVE